MNLHLTLQGKGGVGKTMISVLLAQYLLSKDITPLCVDTDPVNRSFAGFKKLAVTPWDIIENKQAEPRLFDGLINMILAKKERDCVIDSGAASFIPLTAYLQENDTLQFLSENDVKIFIHVVLTGGQSLKDTLRGLDFVIQEFGSSVNVVVWLNEYFGRIEKDGKSFEDFNIFQDNKSSIYGIIKIPQKTPQTFGVDIQQMLEDRVTCDEYIDASEQYFIMPRQRIKIFKKEMFDNISMVLGHEY
jgi:hypothetical protein